MSGMTKGISSGNPLVIAAFHAALTHQLLVVFVIAIALVVAWNVVRARQIRASQTTDATAATQGPADAARVATAVREPSARTVLRIAFGLLWVLDGLLQLQSAMPLGLPSNVLAPAAGGSPSWVVRLVNVAVTTWTNHPITAAASAVWIQLGLGIALLVAPRGLWSRAAGGASAAWGLVVWAFGEAFGAVFAPGSSFLFGTPGAAVFYVIAGILLTLPESAWRTASLGRWLLRVLGTFVVGMGVLQAWPGRGTWQGQPSHAATPGALTSMVQQMAQTPQPSVTSSWLRAFGDFDAAHGWAVNLFVVVALCFIGACLVTAHPRIARLGVLVGVVFCVADWVLVQDFGFFGGLGTDPNSMLPFSFLLVAAYVAMVRPASAVAAPVAVTRGAPAPRERLLSWTPMYLLRVTAALLAASIVVIGAAPMAVAATNQTADPILSEALNGTPYLLRTPAYPFSLVDQHGRHVTLSTFAGSIVVLTFLDPLCTTDCPLISQELRAADDQEGGSRSGIDFVAIAANPIYHSMGAIDAFDRTQGLTEVPNWYYLTGPTAVLQHVWDDYGVQVNLSPAGAMVDHSDIVFVIDRAGNIRTILDADPGDSLSLHSSFTALLEAQIAKVEAARQ